MVEPNVQRTDAGSLRHPLCKLAVHNAVGQQPKKHIFAIRTHCIPPAGGYLRLLHMNMPMENKAIEISANMERSIALGPSLEGIRNAE